MTASEILEELKREAEALEEYVCSPFVPNVEEYHRLVEVRREIARLEGAHDEPQN